jgi:hypothetical protein
MAFSKKTPNTQLPYPADGDIYTEADERKRSDWSQQQYFENRSHGSGVVTPGAINSAGDVAAGEWMVGGYYVRTAAATTPTGRTPGQRNYIVVKYAGTSWWSLDAVITAQTGSAWPAGGMVIGAYEMTAGSAVVAASVVNTDLRVFPTVMAEITSPAVTIPSIAQGTALALTVTHPAISFRASEIRADITGQTDLSGFDVFVDAARTEGTRFVLKLSNVRSPKIAGTAFTVVATRAGIVRDPEKSGLGGVSAVVGNA